MKKINIEHTLYETLEKYPELEDVFFELGFKGVKNPLMRNTHARIMTIKNGIEFLKIDKQKMKEKLESLGYEVEGL